MIDFGRLASFLAFLVFALVIGVHEAMIGNYWLMIELPAFAMGVWLYAGWRTRRWPWKQDSKQDSAL